MNTNDKVDEIYDFFLDNKGGFKDAVLTNLPLRKGLDIELTNILDLVTDQQILISVDHILDASINAVLNAVSTFREEGEE